MRHLPGWVALVLILAATAVAAIDVDLTPAEVDAALKIGRGPDAARVAFHRPYIFVAEDPRLERVEASPH